MARLLVQANRGMTFCYVSGMGTDSTERGRIMWARVKGRTENVLLQMAFKRAFLFRPGFIQPLGGIRSKTPVYQAFYSVLRPLYPLLRHLPSWVTDTATLGRAMIRAAARGYPRSVLESADINRLGAQACEGGAGAFAAAGFAL